ncbi:unnamed protein product [Prorocentrum cordatum]|uniref:Uncharacterized protein n=1 Tax=Prorocentrum cordatum TaxID=2364126 RepID=A0ABN9TIL0_9DINO|nr:unnamed protein product [Polarella glacialis]|mmetsp:Transcript_30053/g.78680  ORF Transcript_30053/g.78680 Transcript_30053/m.78680 type:complete len:438 (+) Transcript_30053:134-1447(+)
MAVMRCVLVAASAASSLAGVPLGGILDASACRGAAHLDQVSLVQASASAKRMSRTAVRGGFGPSREFQGAALLEDAEQEAQGGHKQKLPDGVASPPQAGWNPSMVEYGNWPLLDVPKDGEYSLDHGDTIRSYSWARQDVKILTQLFLNITNGFYIESHAGEGEHGSNSLLFELVGWRGLLMEPRVMTYMALWAKFRKAWLFMGGVSWTTTQMEAGFDVNGLIDMANGHRVPVHPLPSFLHEMGNRKTVDFWALNNGGYEPEVLNTTLNSGYGIEIGVVCATIHDHLDGKGNESWEMRTRAATEQLLFEIMQNASFQYVGGLNPTWVNTIAQRWEYQDAVFVNPSYFVTRGLPVPSGIKSAPPPPLTQEQDQLSLVEAEHVAWDEGHTHEEESALIGDYIRRSKQDAASDETVPKAHRVREEGYLWGSEFNWKDPRHM